jgi:hypothetical protein
MLREEAVWLRQQLDRIDPRNIYPICNLGSATLHFRTIDQPYIDSELFAPARALGHEIVHVDMKAAPGVDVVGDISDYDFVTKLRQRNFKSVMCCNILEHVVDRQQFSDIIMSFIEPGGYIVASVPNDFPYHEDPIDTMFRPDINDVAKLFPGTDIVSAKIVRASSFGHDMKYSWRAAFWLAVRVCVPIYRPRRWATSVRYIRRLWRGYRVTCVILRRPLRTNVIGSC